VKQFNRVLELVKKRRRRRAAIPCSRPQRP